MAGSVEAGLPFVLPAIVFGAFIRRIDLRPHLLTAIRSPRRSPFWQRRITYGTWPDVAVTLGVIGAVWILHRHRRFSFAPGMGLPILALVAAAIVMSAHAAGRSGRRSPIPCLLAFLLVASSDVALRSRRQMLAFCAGVTALLLFRVATVSEQWRVFDADYREFRAAAAALERGSRVVMIPFDRSRTENRSRLPYWYLASLAVIDRSVFLPHLYTIATPLRFTDGRAPRLTGPALTARRLDWHPATPEFAAADATTTGQVDRVIQRLLPGTW